MKIWLTVLAFCCAACAKQPYMQGQQTTANSNNMPEKNNFTYLALGDSYTIGEAVPQEQSFPYQLTQRLGNNVKPDIIAVTGWTTGELKQGITQRSLQKHDYDVVTLLIGVNNQYRHNSPVEYRTEFAELLNIAIGYAGGNKQHVIVLSIPDWGVTPYGKNYGNTAQTAADIDHFNDINKQETAKQGVTYIDITPSSRLAANDVSLIAADGLHPSGKMYGLWVEQLLPQLQKIIKP
ncbi:hypothetical protein CKK33_02425 [Mucilaginibacter sp. MD40]|uniref:SGNH/GDSL hydrolase family protein n=1 Tax=Mucilaginibacter sp. MD40 TaxID=2029590 RepID=UPI000BAC57BB|nr:SGNH/GDSL hydrolase family protein [Mucilaginibacter sp. MD40]PAW92410.1 hypothetical protein CKK33_02425 [Mucilaginibacter sp. MD40]